MLSGTPVLAAAVDGIPEIVRHGESGWLIDGRDQRSLAEAMLTLLRDQHLRRKLATNGRRDAIARFSIERFSTDMHSLYRAILEIGRTPHPEGVATYKSSHDAGTSPTVREGSLNAAGSPP
jgi:glycosyltransferase involved in cell wall biosynthesis